MVKWHFTTIFSAVGILTWEGVKTKKSEQEEPTEPRSESLRDANIYHPLIHSRHRSSDWWEKSCQDKVLKICHHNLSIAGLLPGRETSSQEEDTTCELSEPEKESRVWTERMELLIPRSPKKHRSCLRCLASEQEGKGVYTSETIPIERMINRVLEESPRIQARRGILRKLKVDPRRKEVHLREVWRMMENPVEGIWI